MDGEFSVLRRPSIGGVEILHARFIRHQYPRHAHEGATIALMDTGTATFMYRGDDFVVGPGDVFLLDAEAVHTGRPVSSEGYQYRVLYLETALLRSLLAPASGKQAQLYFRETVLRSRDIASIVRQTHDTLTAEESALRSEQSLLRLGLLLSRHSGRAAAAERSASAYDHAVATAREYLEAHPAERITLRDLASVALTSPYWLARTFTALVGMPPHAYQTQLRVRLARRLLAAGFPASKVATQAGFYDQAHLSRVFKSYTGVTPAKFSAGAGAVSGDSNL